MNKENSSHNRIGKENSFTNTRLNFVFDKTKNDRIISEKDLISSDSESLEELNQIKNIIVVEKSGKKINLLAKIRTYTGEVDKEKKSQARLTRLYNNILENNNIVMNKLQIDLKRVKDEKQIVCKHSAKHDGELNHCQKESSKWKDFIKNQSETVEKLVKQRLIHEKEFDQLKKKYVTSEVELKKQQSFNRKMKETINLFENEKIRLVDQLEEQQNYIHNLNNQIAKLLSWRDTFLKESDGHLQKEKWKVSLLQQGLILVLSDIRKIETFASFTEEECDPMTEFLAYSINSGSNKNYSRSALQTIQNDYLKRKHNIQNIKMLIRKLRNYIEKRMETIEHKETDYEVLKKKYDQLKLKMKEERKKTNSLKSGQYSLYLRNSENHESFQETIKVFQKRDIDYQKKIVKLEEETEKLKEKCSNAKKLLSSVRKEIDGKLDKTIETKCPVCSHNNKFKIVVVGSDDFQEGKCEMCTTTCIKIPNEKNVHKPKKKVLKRKEDCHPQCVSTDKALSAVNVSPAREKTSAQNAIPSGKSVAVNSKESRSKKNFKIATIASNAVNDEIKAADETQHRGQENLSMFYYQDWKHLRHNNEDLDDVEDVNIDIEGVNIYSKKYRVYAFKNLDPFPEDEFMQLYETFWQVKETVVQRKTRSGNVYNTKGPKISIMKSSRYPELKKIMEQLLLDREKNRVAILVYMRVFSKWLTNAQDERPPWLKPAPTRTAETEILVPNYPKTKRVLVQDLSEYPRKKLAKFDEESKVKTEEK